jgi:hypothetical protein
MAQFIEAANEFAARERCQPSLTQRNLKMCRRRPTPFSGGEFIRWPTTLWLCLIFLSHCARAQILDNILTQQAPYKWFASNDPKHQNHDYLELKPDETRRILLTNGELLRLWFTSSNPDKCDVSLQNGAQNVVLLQNGKARLGELFHKAWLLYPSQNTQSSTRLATNASLVVTNRDKDVMKFFYQAAIRNGQTVSTKPSQSGTGRSLSSAPIQAGDSFDITAGLADNIGVLDEITIVFPATPSRDLLKHLRLRAWWDQHGDSYYSSFEKLSSKPPDVDVPLDALVAQSDGAMPLKNAFVSYDGRTLTLHCPMPFWKGAFVALTNDSPSLLNCSVGWKYRPYNAEPKMMISNLRFHAVYGSSHTENLKPIPILRASGEGAFVGLNLDMRPVAGSTRRTFVFLEGNEVIKADNRVLEGTGNEDFFNSAWYFPDQPFSRSFNGLTNKTQSPPAVSAYRLMIPDAVPFKKSLSFDFGHSGRNRGDDMEYRWVAFWYQKPGGSWQIEDKLTLAEKQAQQARQLAVIESARRKQQAKQLAIGLFLLSAVGGTLAFLRLSSRRKQQT